jgi:hypothetical protein
MARRWGKGVGRTDSWDSGYCLTELELEQHRTLACTVNAKLNHDYIR